MKTLKGQLNETLNARTDALIVYNPKEVRYLMQYIDDKQELEWFFDSVAEHVGKNWVHIYVQEDSYEYNQALQNVSLGSAGAENHDPVYELGKNQTVSYYSRGGVNAVKLADASSGLDAMWFVNKKDISKFLKFAGVS